MWLGVLAWLWPIGLGGRMPVGGDVTQFSLGPMAVLSRALKAGRIPLWNDLWGYGFPGVGESQMGVFYPVHWVLYGPMAPEWAYTLSLVGHFLWGALGASFAARRFGASEAAAGLTGYVWATCGFFAIHLSHQWAYTTGSWMPWAWGLGWSVLRGEGRPRDPLWLAAALALQLLPGHFQLAFLTQVGLILLVLEQAAERIWRRERDFSRIALAAGGFLGAFLLASAQLWPTLRLARLASQRRDFEYLSGFAAAPFHLVSFLAPGLFEISPLWRLVAWDPFHTSPEEYLGYVGLVPLLLALGAIWKGWRGSEAVRALLFVGLVAIYLALGPYVPGFASLCQLPGFSFFRAPARWILPASLCLALLAGLGFDGFRTWLKPRRACLRFSLCAILTPGLVLLAFEFALVSSDAWPMGSVPGRILDRMPWGESGVLPRLVGDARRPFLDPRVRETWARQGVILRSAPRPIFTELRGKIYLEELRGTVTIILGLAALAAIGGSGRARLLPPALILLTVLDLGFVNRPRRNDFGPIRALKSQSVILSRLNELPPGTRTVDTLRNMPMVVGAGSVSAYRTLDLPALISLTALAGGATGRPEEPETVASAIKATGASVRIFDPFEVASPTSVLPSDRVETTEDLVDKTLAGWRFGVDWIEQVGEPLARFRVAGLRGPSARAWRVPLTATSRTAILGEWSGQAPEVLRTLEGMDVLEVARPSPEERRLTFTTDGPAVVVLNELADPEWMATLEQDGRTQAAKVERAFGRANQGAWQAVQIPGQGRWTLRLWYRGRDVHQGMVLSALALIGWAWLFARLGRKSSEPEKGESS